MNKIYTITKVACSTALLIALTACGNSGKDEASKVKGTGLPKAGVSTTGAPKIAYIEVDSLMTQYEFCKEYTLELTKRSENYQATINSRMQKLQNDVAPSSRKPNKAVTRQKKGKRRKPACKSNKRSCRSCKKS